MVVPNMNSLWTISDGLGGFTVYAHTHSVHCPADCECRRPLRFTSSHILGKTARECSEGTRYINMPPWHNVGLMGVRSRINQQSLTLLVTSRNDAYNHDQVPRLFTFQNMNHIHTADCGMALIIISEWSSPMANHNQ